MNKFRRGILVALAILAASGSSCATADTPKPASTAATQERADKLTLKKWERQYGARLGEIIMFTNDATGPGATGVAYNTWGVPGSFTLGKWKALEVDTLKASFKVDGVWLNGPRQSLVDTVIAYVLYDGKLTTVGGMPMYTVSHIHVPDLKAFLHKVPPYEEKVVQRTNQWIFNKGREVYELVASNGSVYTMQACSQHIDPSLTKEKLPTLGARLKLPDGWKYRVRKLDSDLVMSSEAGANPAHIVLDEFENIYQLHSN